MSSDKEDKRMEQEQESGSLDAFMAAVEQAGGIPLSDAQRELVKARWLGSNIGAEAALLAGRMDLEPAFLRPELTARRP